MQSCARFAAQARHLALAEELKGAVGRVQHLTLATAAADQENAQLTAQLQAAQAQVRLRRAACAVVTQNMTITT
jgi:hypothetical protein